MSSPVAATAGFRLSLSPASVRLTNHPHYAGSVRVTDSGTQPLHVQMSVIRLAPTGAHCNQSTGTPAWLTINGSAPAFTLKAGQARTVKYTVNASHGQTGSAAVVATATLAKAGHKPGQISASAGSRVTVGTTATCHQAAALPPPSGGPSTMLILIPAVFVVLAIVALALVRRARRHRTA